MASPPVTTIKNVSRHGQTSPGTALTAVKHGFGFIKRKVSWMLLGTGRQTGSPAGSVGALGSVASQNLSRIHSRVCTRMCGRGLSPPHLQTEDGTAPGPRRRPRCIWSSQSHLEMEMQVKTTRGLCFTPTSVARVHLRRAAGDMNGAAAREAIWQAP